LFLKKIEVFPDFARRCVLLAPEGIESYRILQLADGKLVISLKTSPSIDRSKIEAGVVLEFEKLARLLNARTPDISFNSEFEEQGLKKLRRVERRVQ
jgi:phenylacetate-coenzyme A ligase PaaK-like adenylate-forming protein